MSEQTNNLTLGSLFDGSGGFPLAGTLCGITPKWASEIEPFPIAVTRKNIPTMQHLGSISDIHGGEILPVDIITGGSPCQDLSIAGKRAGLTGSRSNLFYEMIRIVREMREASHGKYPRYLVWENVCGAFSSNNGEDFRCVLTQVAHIADKTISIPKPTKWQKAGCIVGDTFSIAWRVLDAQYFGVPQRRRRIFLVADFNGQGARQILFEQESLSGDFTKGETTKRCATPRAKKGVRDSICLNNQGGNRMEVSKNVTSCLRARSNHPPLVFENHGQDARYTPLTKVASSLLSTYGTGGNNQPFVVYDIRQTSANTKNTRHCVYESTLCRTLDTTGNCPRSNQGGLAVVNRKYTLSKNSHFTKAELNKVGPLVATDYKDPPVVNSNIIRRITPLECCRLQGFPDDWCDNLGCENPSEEDIKFWTEVFRTVSLATGKRMKTEQRIRKWLSNPYSDSAAYKMWGNGVALPCVHFILSRICHYSLANPADLSDICSTTE